MLNCFLEPPRVFIQIKGFTIEDRIPGNKTLYSRHYPFPVHRMQVYLASEEPCFSLFSCFCHRSPEL